LRKFTKIPCAVSGRRYKSMAFSADAPNLVPNIRLNCFTSVQFLEPVSGSAISSSSIKALTSSRSPDLMNAPYAQEFPFLLERYSITRGLVVSYWERSKDSPKRAAAFSISFLLFWLSFSA
jgi:hypothetical protein